MLTRRLCCKVQSLGVSWKASPHPKVDLLNSPAPALGKSALILPLEFERGAFLLTFKARWNEEGSRELPCDCKQLDAAVILETCVFNPYQFQWKRSLLGWGGDKVYSPAKPEETKYAVTGVYAVSSKNPVASSEACHALCQRFLPLPHDNHTITHQPHS